MFKLGDIAEYVVVLIDAFAKRYSLQETEAYRYLSQYGAIQFAHEYYDVMHTQPMNDMVDSIALYCQRKGGRL